MAEYNIDFDREKQLYYTNMSIIKGLFNNSIDLSTISSTGSTNSFKNISDINMGNTTLDNSLFKRNTTGYDIKAACQWITNHSYPQYIKDKCGKCAKNVRYAMDIGFNTDPDKNSYTGKTGRPQWAWKYKEYLPKIGFKHIGTYGNDFKAEAGDLAVYMKNGNPNEPGHICMFNGEQWISDFKQKNMIVYNNTKLADIFRFES